MSTAPDGRVNWVTVEATDGLYTEMKAYCEVRRLLPLWTAALRKKVRESACALQSLDTVDGIIKGLPRAAQMLDGRWGDDSAASAVEAAGGLPAWVNRPWVWRFNGAYCEFSNTNNFSRTWLMVTLANVLQALEDEQRKLTAAEQHQPRPTYDKLEAAYQTWKTLAEKHARKPTMAQVREMETGLKDVRPRKRHAEVKQMLDALLETLKSADV